MLAVRHILSVLWTVGLAAGRVGPMERWALGPKPAAVLEPQDLVPFVRADGSKITRWRTRTGVLWAQVIYASCRIEWYQLIEQ